MRTVPPYLSQTTLLMIRSLTKTFGLL